MYDGEEGSSHSLGGTFRRVGGVDVVGEEVVDEGPEMDGGGLRSLRIKRPFVVDGGGSGSSFVGLGEREGMLIRSLLAGMEVEAEVVLPRNRRTPFIMRRVYGDELARLCVERNDYKS